jgi:hypothetical protein
MTNEKNDKIKTVEYDQLMQNMSADEREQFLRHMKMVDQIMDENRDVLKKLADS